MTAEDVQANQTSEDSVQPLVTMRNFPNGLTVKELKELVKDWPEVDSDGDPTEVWMETGLNRSSPVRAVWPLNHRGGLADIIFESTTLD